MKKEVNQSKAGQPLAKKKNLVDKNKVYPVEEAVKLAKKLSDVRKDNTLPYLRPDGKSQVTVEYDDDKPIRVDTVVIAAQHDEDVDLSKLREDIFKYVIETKEWKKEIVRINDGKFSLTKWLKDLPENQVDSDWDWKEIGIEEAKFKTLNLLKKLNLVIL